MSLGCISRRRCVAEGDSNAGTLCIEGSHKVPIPTAELLALAEGGLAGSEGSELVKHVPMDVGDTMFFMETLIHAAPEVRCNDRTTAALEAAESLCAAVFAQLCGGCCAMAALLCCDCSAVTCAGLDLTPTWHHRRRTAAWATSGS